MSITRVYSPGILNELLNKTIIFHNILFESNIKENIIEEILSTTKNHERQIIRHNYKKLFHHPIQNDIIEKLKDKNLLLYNISINMLDTPFEYDARELKNALSKNNGVDEDIIIEILSSRPKKNLEMVDLAYKNFFDISLKEEIQNKLSKEYSEYLLALMDVERPIEQTISKEQAFEISKDIIKNGIKLYATDVSLFKNIFIEKSRKDLILISRAFFELEKKCLLDEIEDNEIQNNKINEINVERKEINNKLNLIKNILFAIITPAEFFAHKCKEALTASSGNINNLIRVLISRAEIDIKIIRDYYFKETKSDIKNDIKKDSHLKDNINISNVLINIFK